jgi:hypothetical protein
MIRSPDPSFPHHMPPAEKALLILTMLIGALLVLVAIVSPKPMQAAGLRCDVALVLTMDVSGSMEEDEFDLQRGGTANAFRDPLLQDVIMMGVHGRVAVSVVQFGWKAWPVVDWHVIDDKASADRFADIVEETPRAVNHGGTSIIAGLQTAHKMYETLPCLPDRKVVDVSGDGEDALRVIRRYVEPLDKDDIRINGLVISDVDRKIYDGGVKVDGQPYVWGSLKEYFEDQVRTGPGSFVLAIRSFSEYGNAILAKLMKEMS